LQEIDEALAIDPEFLAARALRHTILTTEAKPSIQPAGPSITQEPSHELFEPEPQSPSEDASSDLLRGASWQPRAGARRHPVAMFAVAAAIAGGAFVAGVLWSRTHPPPSVGARARPASSDARPSESHTGTGGDTEALEAPAPASPVRDAATAKKESPGADTPEPPTKEPAPRQPAAERSPTKALPAQASRAPVASDDAQVRSAVERFRMAYNARAASHRESGMSALAFDRCEVSAAAGSGLAICPKAGQNAAGDQSVWTFTLIKNGDDWSIKSIAVQ